MTIKDAATNSLLMLVASACVVLITRALPPAQQLSTAAQAGVLPAGAAPAAGMPTPAPRDGILVYYLHGATRCPTCRTIEAYAREAVETGFADALKSGAIRWQVINYEEPGNEHYATDYNVVAPNVVLVKFQDGKQVAWKGLPEVWEVVGDKAAFLKFVETSLQNFRQGETAEATPEISLLPPAEVAPDTSEPLPLPVTEP